MSRRVSGLGARWIHKASHGNHTEFYGMQDLQPVARRLSIVSLTRLGLKCVMEVCAQRRA